MKMISSVLITILFLSKNTHGGVVREEATDGTNGGCVVPSCAYSDIDLDSALSTFLCIPKEQSAQMEEKVKMSLLISNIRPLLPEESNGWFSYSTSSVNAELHAMNSFELVTLVNTVTYGAHFYQVVFQDSDQKTAEQYRDLIVEHAAVSMLHKPLDEITYEEMNIFRDVSPIVLLYNICSAEKTPGTRMEFNDCTCSSLVNPNGFGDCKKEDSAFGGAVSCYVNLPTNCTDLKQSGTNPEKYLSAQACQFIGCTCSSFVNPNGYGKCLREDSDFGGAVSCYVEKPSNCADLKQSETHPELYLSAEACK